MGKDKEDDRMISPNQKNQQTETAAASNDAVMNLAKKGMKKYRKTLDKLAKN